MSIVPPLPAASHDEANIIWGRRFRRARLFRRAVLGGVLILWCAGLVAGALALWRYSSTPGTTGIAPARWPENTLVQPQPGRATLVMLAHPHCPCTRASLSELARLQARVDADTWILFLRPTEAKPDWEKTDLWETAAAIPGARPIADKDGTAARTFGAETSGHVLLYDANGALRFSGGITASRGHEGLSAGGEAILATLHGGNSGLDRTFTFGCPLQSEKSPQ